MQQGFTSSDQEISCCNLQVSPIQMGLKDAHPYVRRTAVMGVLKVFNMDEEFVQNSGLPNSIPAPSSCSAVLLLWHSGKACLQSH